MNDNSKNFKIEQEEKMKDKNNNRPRIPELDFSTMSKTTSINNGKK
jgi:translation initiation factor 2 beta subunit (eIF-2beta)/eIF-5